MIHVTHHAIARYLERVEDCSRHDARERLLHAVAISERASEAMLQRALKGGPVKQRGVIGRYCPVESLLLLLRPATDGFVLVTVFRVQGRVVA